MNSESVTIQVKATEEYFPAVLYIMLYRVGQCINSLKVTSYIKVTEKYVFVVLFISNTIVEPGG